ncbi:MAG: transporter substrate-binding domain-containing protein, partial [Pseudomonas graminis]
MGHSSENLPFALGAPFLAQQPIALNDADRQWLDARKTLRVGISVADHEPVDITTDRNRYQGISADYLSVVSARLAIPVQVRGFAKREKAVEALLAGDIDVLTSASGFERNKAGLSMTRDYLADRAVVFGRANDTSLKPTLEGKRVVLLDGYADAAVVQRIYPESDIVLAPTLYSAMEALAHDDADALIANELVVQSYSLLRPYLGLHSKFDSLLPPMGFSFALRDKDARLHALFDRVLADMDESLHREILSRWTVGLGADPARRQVSINPVEQL